MQIKEIEMKEIVMTLPEIASYMDKISVFIPINYPKINEIVEDAFSLFYVPGDEILEITSEAETIEDCIDEYWLPGLSGTHKDKAAIRRMIELAENKSDLNLIFSNIEPVLAPESFEFKLFLRKAAEIL